MLTEKTNKTLYRVLITIGVILLLGGMILDFLPDNIVPQNDWYRVLMMCGIPLAIIGDYFKSLTLEEDENGGCGWFGIGMLTLFWIDRINHFTAPIIAGTVFGSILLIIAFILNGKRWRRVKAKEKEEQKEQEESENQA
ncbi:MAG: hypothetical protein IKW85_08810 [Muribaculaceae bacterium]|nr:hypothetical protein [Muribaculaceae bacterium]